MKGEPTGFWGKLERDENNRVRSWHPLADHCADVAACTEALLTTTLLRQRLARLAGQIDLSDSQVSRLSVLAALHDIGKFSIGFQNKGLGLKPQCGHLSELLGLFGDQRYRSPLLAALAIEQLATWGEGLDALLIATIGHHGRPVSRDCQVEPAWWQPARGLDPFAGIAKLVEQTNSWFPAAWAEEGDRLPASSRFQHAWAGLLMLADWIGSDSDRFFPFSEKDQGDRMPASRRRAAEALSHLGLDPRPARRSLGRALPGFQRIAPEKKPRPAQATILDLKPKQGGSVAILEAETGSGKTEAALVYFARLFHQGLVDGLYFALPTRTAATQMYRRVREARDHAFSKADSRPPVVLAVPGYLEVDGVTGARLPHFKVLWNDDPIERFRYRGWAAEHPKRYLAGAIAVGTIDQVLLSALTVSHAHMRSSALLRHLLVVDEVHASDAYMTRVLEEVLDQHLLAGGHALLMSATLGVAARSRLLAQPGARGRLALPPVETAAKHAYPLISFRQEGSPVEELRVPEVGSGRGISMALVPAMESAEFIARQALDAAAAGARLLVVRNTVRGCQDVQIELERVAESERIEHTLFRCEHVSAPHHSRYARGDRQLLDAAIESSFGLQRPAGGCVAVATQTVEQSLDLDADLMITDLCPLDVLLQRVGRLHRHPRSRPAGFEKARVVVLVPAQDLASYLRSNGEARGPHGLGTVYRDLRVLELTSQVLRAAPTVSIPADNRSLVEAATHPEALEALCQSRGEAWIRHNFWVQGAILGEGRLGVLNCIKREIPFDDDNRYLFPSGDMSRRIPTRLGEADRLVRFAEAQSSPFSGKPEIRELTLPAHIVPPGIPADVHEAKGVVVDEAGFTFQFGGRRYRYDSLGLRMAGMPADESDA